MHIGYNQRKGESQLFLTINCLFYRVLQFHKRWFVSKVHAVIVSHHSDGNLKCNKGPSYNIRPDPDIVLFSLVPLANYSSVFKCLS